MIFKGGETLETGCFYADVNLATIDSTSGEALHISGSGTFQECVKYGLKQKNGSYTPFKVVGTTLAQTFYVSSGKVLTREDIQHFIDDCVPEDNKVQSLNRFCHGQEKIVYTADDLKNDIVNKSTEGYDFKYLRLGKFKNCNSLRQAFRYTGINAWHKESFNGVGANVSTIDTYGTWDNDTGCTIPIDVYGPIATKATCFLGKYNGWNSSTTWVVDGETGKKITDKAVDVYTLLHPGGVTMTSLVDIKGFNNPSQKMNFHSEENDCSAFQGLVKLTYVTDVMYGSNAYYNTDLTP